MEEMNIFLFLIIFPFRFVAQAQWGWWGQLLVTLKSSPVLPIVNLWPVKVSGPSEQLVVRERRKPLNRMCRIMREDTTTAKSRDRPTLNCEEKLLERWFISSNRDCAGPRQTQIYQTWSWCKLGGRDWASRFTWLLWIVRMTMIMISVAPAASLTPATCGTRLQCSDKILCKILWVRDIVSRDNTARWPGVMCLYHNTVNTMLVCRRKGELLSQHGKYGLRQWLAVRSFRSQKLVLFRFLISNI